MIIIRVKLSSIFVYTITFIVLAFLVIFVQPENFLEKLYRLGIWGVAILTFFYITDLMIRVYRWKILLNAQEIDLPSKSLIMPVISALAINLFTIARAGEVVRLYALKRKYGTNYSDTFSSIVIEQILSIFGLVIVVTGSLFFVWNSLIYVERSEIIIQLVVLLILFSIGCLIVLFIAFLIPDFIIKFLQIFPEFIKERLTSIFNIFQLSVKNLRSQPILLGSAVFLSAIIWIIEGIMLYIIALIVFASPFGFEDLPWIIAASCAGNITFIIPLLPGAMGQYEFVVALVLINSPHYPGTDATLIALIDRVIKSTLLFLFGGYAILKLGGTELLYLRKSIFNNEELQ